LAIARIRKWWNQHAPDDYDGPGIIGLVAPVGDGKLDWVADWLGPWDFVAFVLFVAWLAVLIISLFYFI
jgi:hypothetical protein